MATTPELQEPQIAAARAKAWHQAPQRTSSASASPAEASGEETGEEASAQPQAPPASPALLTLEAAREFVTNFGLVLFAPRPLGAPAPSLVEATLGATRPSGTPAESATARGLVARLVAEGSALPLNLLGGPGDLPDFVVSTSAFPFVFTLRGDKGWKRPPETSGAVKVTPLALRVYELLSERAATGGGMTVAEIVSEAGREVTESAIGRSLNELWQLLRVIPALQQGEGETLWELTTTRFIKAVKAGANAGQPTALSALISLYLGQAYLATEEEIASFLSPLTARSRVRDVLHGLTAGRQLSETVLEGKTVLYIPDALPDFAAEAAENEEAEDGDFSDGELDGDSESTGTGESSPGEADGAGRIQRFGGEGGAARKANLRGKPLSRESKSPAGPRPASDRAARTARAAGGERPARAPRGDGDRPARPARSFGADRPSRPFTKRPALDAGGEPASARPSYTKPWNEDRGTRPPRREGASGDRPSFSRPRPEGDRPAFRRDRPAGDRPSSSRERSGGDRPPFRRESSSGDRPSFPRKRAEGDRPPFRREGAEGERPAYRRDRPSSDRPSFSRPGGERPPFRREDATGGDRPRPRRTEGAPGERPARPYTPRPREGGYAGGGEARPPRAPRGERPGAGFGPREDRSNRGGGGAGGDRPPRSSRPSFDRSAGPGAGRPPAARSYERPRAPRDGDGGGRPFTRGPGRPPARAAGGEGRSFGDRPGRGAGGFERGGPGGGSGDRPAPRPGGFGGSRAGGGFGGSRAAGGFGASRPGGFSRGPAKGPGRGGPRKGPGGPGGDRPTPRRKPEDEA